MGRTKVSVWYHTVLYAMPYQVWYGIVWYGMVWYRYGMVWYGMVSYGIVWYGIGMVWYRLPIWEDNQGIGCRNSLARRRDADLTSHDPGFGKFPTFNKNQHHQH